MIVMDTNVLSELAKPVVSPSVLAWANAQSPEILYTTTITEAELLFGLACLPEGRRRQALRGAVETVLSVLLAGRVLAFDRAAAQAYATLAAERRRLGRPGASADLQIAAIALANGALAIATRNVRDFAGCGLTVIDPWQAAIPAGQIEQ